MSMFGNNPCLINNGVFIDLFFLPSSFPYCIVSGTRGQFIHYSEIAFLDTDSFPDINRWLLENMENLSISTCMVTNIWALQTGPTLL